MRYGVGVLALMTMAMAAGPAAAGAPVRVRSFLDGADLTAVTRVEPVDGATTAAARRGGEEDGWTPEPRRLAAPGHLPLVTRLPVGELAARVTVWLDPLPELAAAQEQRVRERVPGGFGALYGWVYDRASGRPLEGAVVALEGTGVSVRTGADGGYLLLYPLGPEGPDGLPPADTLTIRAPGHRTLEVHGVLLLDALQRRIEDLTPGRGRRVVDETPEALRPERQGEHQTAPAPDEGRRPPEGPAVPPLPAGLAARLGVRAATLAPVLAPPSTIRVGTSCRGTRCDAVSVMSLESYVAAGLDEEWIASWGQHALRAGAVAYRSYGAWYVAHPLSSRYDICSTTSCQVFAPDVVTATRTAGNATAGFLLERGGAVFRAEFSAENNSWNDPYDGLRCVNSDLSCGDGRAGSPAAGWPCLDDPVCAGHGCFGHGRGMCQWGTSRWAARGKLWRWIADHYYNAGGAGSGQRTAVLASPVRLDGFSPVPATVAPGGTFAIRVDATDLAGLGHDRILVGASLRGAGGGWISDPPHDATVSLVPGSNTVSRQFTVPAGAAPGVYDLAVSLFLDVNEDGAISGDDLVLGFAIHQGAVTVAAAARDVLDDGDFEGGRYGSPGYGSSGTAGPWRWTSSGGIDPITQDAGKARGGSWLAWLNGYGQWETDTVEQTVTLPSGAGSATLVVHVRVVTAETTTRTAYDTLKVQVVDGSGAATTLTTVSNLDASSGYRELALDVTPWLGSTVTVRFLGREDGSLATSFYLDDLALEVR